MKTLNDFFSKIYCINLDRRPDKYELCLPEFKKLNLEVNRVSGVDGRTVTTPSPRWAPGCYGLVLTNIKILTEAIENKFDSILILEDDVMFHENFYEIFNERIKFLPDDWDILYLGGNNIFRSGTFTLVTGDKNFVPTQNNYRSLNYELAKTTLTFTTHAVGINSKYFDKLMERIGTNSTEPIDNIYVTGQQDGTCNAYTFLPSLALQRPNFSDIDERFADYNIPTNGF